MYLTRITTPIGLILLISTSACHKDTSSPRQNSLHKLGVPTDRIIKIDQAVTVYDSTSLKDSALYLYPPVNSIYEWSITPDTYIATFSGPYRNGRANIIFSKSGNYRITASIYDSISHTLLGHTDTIAVTVTTDTLYPEQPIQKDDELIITPSILVSNANGSILSLSFSSLDQYDYKAPTTQFKIDGADFTFIFSDSLQLATWPFAQGYGVRSKATETLLLGGFSIGEPANIKVVWLDKTYTGTVTFNTYNNYTFNWDNSGAVKVNILH